MIEVIRQRINDSTEMHIEMESIGDLPIVQDGLVTGLVRRAWIHRPAVPLTLVEEEKEQDG